MLSTHYQYQHQTRPVALRRIIALSILLLFFSAGWAGAANQPFPIYPVIRENVNFWIKVYSVYSINSAVIHDRNDLTKVYGIVQLLDKKHPDSGQVNRKIQEQAVQAYAKILRSLGNGKTPTSKAEKRISKMFRGPDRNKRLLDAADNVRSQRGQKERFREGYIRSGAYLPKIKRIFAEKGLPTELAYLPHVESSFDTSAYSKFGAAGMWQFTRATGKQFLQINDAVDERRDPFIAADGAARYLKDSYMKLANWPMAITSYNYGTAGMERAKEALGTYPDIFKHYNEGHFGFASKNFYSEFLAARTVAKQLARDHSIKQNRPTSFTSTLLPAYIHIKDVKKHFKISTSILKKLNPALRPAVFSGKKLIPKGYRLRLPVGATTQKRIRTLPKSYFSASQSKDSFYRVKRGDTALGIAVKHGITLRTLRKANSLDRKANIYIGQRLRIPSGRKAVGKNLRPYLTPSQKKRFINNTVTAKKQTQDSKKAIAAIPVFSGSKKSQPSEESKENRAALENVERETITVHPEESLGLLAMWLKIPANKLRAINNLSPSDSIEPGQEITVPYTKTSAATFAELRAQYAKENEDDFFQAYDVINKTRYTVKPGDTLWRICNVQFNIPLWLLKKYNDDLNYGKIFTSQQLTIPVVRRRSDS